MYVWIKKRALAVCAVFLASEALAGIPWLDEGIDIINKGIEHHQRTQREIREGGITDNAFEEELVPIALGCFSKVAEYIPPANKGPYDRTREKLQASIKARQLTWDIFVALHVRLADLISQGARPFADRKAHLNFQPYIDVWINDSDPAEMVEILRKKRAFAGDLSLIPIFAKTAKDALLGVRTLNKAFSHGVVPIILACQVPDVHGGMFSSPIDFLLHDWAHGFYFWKEFYLRETLRAQLPLIREQIGRFSDDSSASCHFHARLILYIHEWTSFTYCRFGARKTLSPLQYYQFGYDIMRKLIDQSLDEIKIRKAHSCLSRAQSVRRWGEPVTSMQVVTFKLDLIPKVGPIFKVTLDNGRTLFHDVPFAAEFTYSTDEFGHPQSTCFMTPQITSSCLLPPELHNVSYSLNGDDFRVHHNSFRDLGILLGHAGFLPSGQDPLKNPLVGKDLWCHLEKFMHGFDPTFSSFPKTRVPGEGLWDT